MKFRSLIGGLGLLGILSLPTQVEGQDTAAVSVKEPNYAELTSDQITNLVEQKAENVTYTFNQAVKKYAGASIVLFGSTCHHESIDVINRNMEIVFLKLIDKFKNARVNNFSLKFALYDGCRRREILDLGVIGLETYMYLDGREILRKRGGPTNDNGPNDIDSIDSFVKAFDFLIRKNFTEFDGSTRYLVNEEGKIYKDSSP